MAYFFALFDFELAADASGSQTTTGPSLQTHNVHFASRPMESIYLRYKPRPGAFEWSARDKSKGGGQHDDASITLLISDVRKQRQSNLRRDEDWSSRENSVNFSNPFFATKSDRGILEMIAHVAPDSKQLPFELSKGPQR